jgi:hypothetical protein
VEEMVKQNDKIQEKEVVMEGIPVYDIPLLKGVDLSGINRKVEIRNRNYYVEILKREASKYQDMINSIAVDHPVFYVRWLEKVGLSSRESRRSTRKSKMERILDVYQKKESWLKREILSEQAQQEYLIDDVKKDESGIMVLIKEIESEGFDVGVVNGNPYVYEVEDSDPGIMSQKLRVRAYREQRRGEFAERFDDAIKSSEEGSQLTEINEYIGELRQARMYVNNYIKILKSAVRAIDKGKVKRINFSKVIYNGKDI